MGTAFRTRMGTFQFGDPAARHHDDHRRQIKRTSNTDTSNLFQTGPPLMIRLVTTRGLTASVVSPTAATPTWQRVAHSFRVRQRREESTPSTGSDPPPRSNTDR
jgi:hypothetical protein